MRPSALEMILEGGFTLQRPLPRRVAGGITIARGAWVVVGGEEDVDAISFFESHCRWVFLLIDAFLDQNSFSIHQKYFVIILTLLWCRSNPPHCLQLEGVVPPPLNPSEAITTQTKQFQPNPTSLKIHESITRTSKSIRTHSIQSINMQIIFPPPPSNN